MSTLEHLHMQQRNESAEAMEADAILEGVPCAEKRICAI